MKKKIIVISIFVIMISLIVNPSRYMDSVSKGLMIFIVSVLPSLFPFFFFTKLLTALGIAGNISYYMQKPVNKLYNTAGIGGYVLIMSMMSGYPVGAKLISDLYEMNAIDTAEAKKISAFSSSSGPLFILGTIGSSIIGNYQVGLVILISHYLSSFFNGFIYRGKKQATHKNSCFLPAMSYDRALSESVYNAIISILTVGSFIIIFNLVGDILTDIKVLTLLEKAVEFILKLLRLPTNVARGLCYGFIEITRGNVYLSESGVSLKLIAPLATMMISFGGLGIALQSISYLSRCKISPWYYIKTKLTQSVIALIISIPLSFAFNL